MRIQVRDCRCQAFTVLELMTVLVIVFILTILAIPSFRGIQAKAERASCVSNLKSLFVAASSYVQDHKQWPQIDPALLRSSEKAYFSEWVAALKPYGVEHKSWICPTIQRAFGKPDYTDDDYYRTDYAVSIFDDREFAPREYATQPWFLERADAHGNGNLLIYGDGSIEELNDVRNRDSGG